MTENSKDEVREELTECIDVCKLILLALEDKRISVSIVLGSLTHLVSMICIEHGIGLSKIHQNMAMSYDQLKDFGIDKPSTVK